MKRIVYLNGKIVPEDQAYISVFDRGFLYGDGIFETVRVYESVPFRWDMHIQRMVESAQNLGINWKGDPELRTMTSELLRKNDLKDAYLRITLSRGIHTGDLGFDTNAEPTIAMIVDKLRLPSDEDYERGVGATIIPHTWISPMAAHKSLSYLPYLAARNKARADGVYEALLCGAFGRLAEGTTSNLFMVFGGRVFTPPADGRILPGIARQVVIDSLLDLGVKCIDEYVGAEDVRGADEIFITNSIIEVLPVTTLDGIVVGGGNVGPVTKKTLDAYRARVEKEVRTAK